VAVKPPPIPLKIARNHEISLLVPTQRNDWLRPQVQSKLDQLNPADPVHIVLHHLASLSLDLFEAVDNGWYVPADKTKWKQIRPILIRALAYFVKTSDAIPDHLPKGFDDDHREFKQLAEEACFFLLHFESVRNQFIRNQSGWPPKAASKLTSRKRPPKSLS
jgi:hypothetical protein